MHSKLNISCLFSRRITLHGLPPRRREGSTPVRSRCSQEFLRMTTGHYPAAAMCCNSVAQTRQAGSNRTNNIFFLYLYLFAKLSGCRWFFRGLPRSHMATACLLSFRRSEASSLLSLDAPHPPPSSQACPAPTRFPSITASTICRLATGLLRSSLQPLKALSNPPRCSISKVDRV